MHFSQFMYNRVNIPLELVADFVSRVGIRIGKGVTNLIFILV